MRFFIFYVSLIFQNVQLVFTWGGGGGEGPEKKFRYCGGGGGGGRRRFEKKMEIFKFSPIPPPLIYNERSLNI